MSKEKSESQAASQVTTEQAPLDAVVRETTRRQSIASEAAARLGVAPAKVCELLRHVWTTSKGQQPLTDQEMFTGMSMIARFDLDPVAKEVYVTRDNKGRLLTIVGIDGWIKIIHRTDHYDGFEQEEHIDDKGLVDWVETRIFSTRLSRPTTYRARASEYGKLGGYVAGIIPIHMLKLFSFRHAARFFAPMGGVHTEEEADWMQAARPGSSFTAPPTDLDGLTDASPIEKAKEAMRKKSAAAPKAKPEPAPPTPLAEPDPETEPTTPTASPAKRTEIERKSEPPSPAPPEDTDCADQVAQWLVDLDEVVTIRELKQALAAIPPAWINSAKVMIAAKINAKIDRLRGTSQAQDQGE